jgi:mRNA-degrading endonuclease RelE of RelBE toxin-antitoxin system
VAVTSRKTSKKRYRQILQGNYRLIYRYDEKQQTVFAVAVVHAARLLDPDSLE